MPSTTNFNWTTPADTDLVKDGAAAIRTLANGIDTSFVDLKGGTTGQVLSKNSNTDLDFTWVAQDDSNAIQNAIVDAKGDLIAATAADTPARLAVGTNGQVLTADSTAATGLAWTTPAAGGGITLLATATIDNTSSQITLNSISSSYKNLYLVGRNISVSGGTYQGFYMRVNNSSTAVYSWNAFKANNTTTVTHAGAVSDSSWNIGAFTASLGVQGDDSEYWTNLNLMFPNYASTSTTKGAWYNVGRSGSSQGVLCYGQLRWRDNTAVSRIDLWTETGANWQNGTLYLYGEN